MCVVVSKYMVVDVVGNDSQCRYLEVKKGRTRFTSPQCNKVDIIVSPCTLKTSISNWPWKHILTFDTLMCL